MRTFRKNIVNPLNIILFGLVVLVFVFWPTSFFLKNSFANFIHDFVPNVALLLAFFLYIRQKKYWMYALLVIPIINNTLSIFPLIVGLFLVVRNYRSKLNLVYILIAVSIFIGGFNGFYQASVFKIEHFEQQKIIMKANLYPEIFPTKLLQNPLSASWINFKENFFMLIDPNNYFFGLHPGEKVGYQNLYKFSFVYIGFFLIGLYYIFNFKYFKFILILLPSIIINLSLIKIFDLVDSLLFFPVTMIITFGIFYSTKLLENKIYLIVALGVIFLFVSFDFLRLLLSR